MVIIEIILLVLIVAAAIALTIAVLFQKNKNPVLSGAISGGASETHYGKGKVQNRDKLLNKITIALSIFFAVVVIAYCVIQPFTVKYDYGDPEAEFTAPEETTTTEAETTTSTPETTVETPDSSDETPEA